MPIIQPEQFNMQDLFLEVQLEASILNNEQNRDFTGRNTFKAELFRENIGFGITKIDVVINTSLQPIIEITFKDLYGNTLFGGDFNKEGIDYSGIHNWPPPKFYFTFKGYLGKPVTWVLNLKKYGAAFMGNDGSYELKASFVPNQWGFFADIPFKFLLATKGLLKKEVGISDDVTIYDLIKIGKVINKKTEEFESKYNDILAQMNAMDSGALSSQLSQSTLLQFDQDITGEVDGKKIAGFAPIKIAAPPFSSESERYLTDINKFREEYKLITNSTSPTDISILNNFILTKTSINSSPIDNRTYEQFKLLSQEQQNNIVGNRKDVIKKNIDLIKKAKIAETYDANKDMLGKVTLGETMRRIAQDSAYIMGRILQAGLQGYENNSSSRDENKNQIVGKYYPLIFDENKQEVAPYGSFGVNEYEAKFVDEFYNAIAEGIVKDVFESNQNNSDSFTSLEVKKLLGRINNTELSSGNPFKPFFNSVAANIMERSAIAAYFTRGKDPNFPGDYSKEISNLDIANIDNDSPSDIRKLAEIDSSNINQDFILSMSNEDQTYLKEFCDFFIKLFDVDGEEFLNFSGEKLKDYNTNNYQAIASNGGQLLIDYLRGNPEYVDLYNDGALDDVSNFQKIFNFRVVTNVNDSTIDESSLNSQAQVVELTNQNRIESISIREYMPNILSMTSFSRGVSSTDMSSRFVINNGVPYFYLLDQNSYYLIVFEGNDVTDALKNSSSPTDQELEANENKDEIITYLGNRQPIGKILVDSYNDSDGNVLGRVKNFNEYVSANKAISYSKLKNASVSKFLQDGVYPDIFWDKKIESEEDVKSFQNGRIMYTIAHHIDDAEDLANQNSEMQKVFDLFGRTRRSINQRVYVRRMCDHIKEIFDSIELKRQQIIQTILGKEDETKQTLYKQFHNLCNQWQSLVTRQSVDGVEDRNVNVRENYDGIATQMREEFGNENNSHIEAKNLNFDDLPISSNSVFVYDFPLQRIVENSTEGDGNSLLQQINIKNAIINMDPLYEPDSRTTVLNAIQNICMKNNFMFIPIPGYPGYLSVKEIYKPYTGPIEKIIGNFFHIVFTPTPESRPYMKETFTFSNFADTQRNIKADALQVKFGAIDNQIVKNLKVDMGDNKVTAESIINLERLVENENTNKTVTTDCSILNVLGGRSYKATIDMLGNAQIFPMQFFFIENLPLFNGLYQILNVKHSIEAPSNMTTSVDGIRMRFNPGSGYGGILPITLETLANTYSEYYSNNPNVPLGVISTTALTETITTVPGLPSDKLLYSNLDQEGGSKPYAKFIQNSVEFEGIDILANLLAGESSVYNSSSNKNPVIVMISIYNRAKRFAYFYEKTKNVSHKTILKYMVLAGWESGQYEPVRSAGRLISNLIKKEKQQSGSPNHELLNRFAKVEKFSDFSERFVVAEFYDTKIFPIPSSYSDVVWNHDSKIKSNVNKVDVSDVYYFIGLDSQRAVSNPKRGLTEVFYDFFKKSNFVAKTNEKDFLGTLKVRGARQSYFKNTASLGAVKSKDLITPIPESNLG